MGFGRFPAEPCASDPLTALYVQRERPLGYTQAFGAPTFRIDIVEMKLSCNKPKNKQILVQRGKTQPHKKKVSPIGTSQFVFRSEGSVEAPGSPGDAQRAA